MITDHKPIPENERAQIPEQYKWNLSALFDSDQQWRNEKNRIEKQLSVFDTFKNTLAQNAEQLFNALDFYFNLEKYFMRLYAYAGMLSDQDIRLSEPLAMKQEMAHLETKLNSAAAFMEPEILTIPEERLHAFLVANKNLEIYSHYLDDILRRKAHTLNEQEEKLIAEAGLMSDTAQEVYTVFSNADLPYKTITLADGKEIKMDPVHYSLYRTSSNRDDRKKVFTSFFGALKEFERTFGTQLYGEIKKNLFYKNVRRYSSCLERSLDRNHIPVTVYHTLIKNIHTFFPVLYRYLRLRKQRLGVEDLQYHDIYPSLVKEIDLEYSYAESQKIIMQSLDRLGENYLQILRKAFKQRWIDVYPNPGKRSGAYMEGIAYDVHPYVLMNYKGKFHDLSTLAHELGHAMHSYFSNKQQPFVNSRYPIFLAEVASTVNEALLMDLVLRQTEDPAQKISLLGHYLEEFRGTLFRQSQFAEFELRIHETIEQGESLTGEKFTQMYLEILKKYYGHEEKICSINDLYGVEWAYIPHFYYNFYVFQYSTSFTAAQAIAAKILQGDPDILPRYLEFLGSGGSDYAIPVLQKLGIDMLGDEPFQLTMKRMEGVMDQIETLSG